jgi:hypothetical protein
MPVIGLINRFAIVESVPNAREKTLQNSAPKKGRRAAISQSGNLPRARARCKDSVPVGLAELTATIRWGQSLQIASH